MKMIKVGVVVVVVVAGQSDSDSMWAQDEPGKFRLLAASLSDGHPVFATVLPSCTSGTCRRGMILDLAQAPRSLCPVSSKAFEVMGTRFWK